METQSELDRDRIAAALPGYDILEKLGGGSFGDVWAGRHRQLGRVDAIKELKPFLADDPEIRVRFNREARVLAGIEHPHIVSIYDCRQDENACLLVMEYLSGGTVWQHFLERGFSQKTACAVAMATCAGLHHAHQQGVLHRDVKPENLLLSKKGQLKVTDFGLAKVVGGNDSLATHGGYVMGTPMYMAPEQAEGAQLGPPADVYSTGVLLYELLSGHLPLSEDGGPLAIMFRKVERDPIPLHEVAATIALPLVEVTMRALARSPGERFPTAEAFGVAIGGAATAAWGPRWLSDAEICVMAPGPILSSVDLPEIPPRAARAPQPRRRPLRAPALARVPQDPPEQPGYEPTLEQPRVLAPAPVPGRVRPSNPVRFVAALPPAISAGDLVPVRRVLRRRQGLVLGSISATLLALAVLVALLGLGAPAQAAEGTRGTLEVNGTDLAESDGLVEVDLAEPVQVLVEAAGVKEDQSVRLRLFLAGIPLPGSSTGILTTQGDSLGVGLDASLARYFVGGRVDAELELFGDGAPSSHRFRLEPEETGLATAPGVVTLALLVLAAATAFWVLRRRGRGLGFWLANVIDMTVCGAVVGVVAVLFWWVFGVSQPGPWTMPASATLGSLAGLTAALSRSRSRR